MKTIRLFSIIVVSLLLITACGDGKKVAGDQFSFLDELGITVTDNLLLGDSLTLPDVYCGDKDQKLSDLKGKKINHKQYEALVVPAGSDFADEMSNWLLLGVRDMGGGITLAVYYACNGGGYCVDLMTYDKQGRLLDAINTRELHMLWRVDLSNTSNDSVYSLDGHITFNNDRVTLHRLMGRCVMDFDGDLKGSPIWQQGWEQEYVINAKGYFVLQGQRIVMENGPVDVYSALDIKAWDMLVCSMHDPDIMDMWNEYSGLVNSTYDPGYQYNPFPWNVAQLYQMNPQRFLGWMAAHRGPDNRLLPQFKLPPAARPALLKEISLMDDAEARQWLSGIVNAWDDKPLTKHL